MSTRPRFREYGFVTGLLPTGRRNTIADVSGVQVGQRTRWEGKDIRTGVTVVDPGVTDLYRRKIPAAVAVGNGFGKVAGISQIQELGTLETPIALTNTLAVGTVVRGLVDVVLARTPGMNPTDSINAVVGETNDGFLNLLHADAVTKEDVRLACGAVTDEVEMGCVGAGTGTRAFAWKGGIGSSSRVVRMNETEYTVGALVQTNYGGALTMLGVPIGRLLGKTDFDSYLPTGDGSCMIVLAIDAPLDARQLSRIARRAFIALGRTGSVLANGSGDYAIAFSTNRNGLPEESGACVADRDLTPFFLAAVESVEESVYDALFLAVTTVGRRDNTLEQIPVGQVVDLLRKRL